LTDTVVDFSFARPDPHQLVTLGITGVCRYLARRPNGKVLDQAELDRYHAFGLHVALNWESTGKSWRQGAQAGALEGGIAGAEASEFGWPKDRPIYQSADEAVPTNLLGTLLDYQLAFNRASGYAGGFYGTSEAIDYLTRAGAIRYGWRTNATGWAGNGFRSQHAVLEQHTSKPFSPPLSPADYDSNEILAADWGANPNPGGSPVPGQGNLVAPIIGPPVMTPSGNGYWLIATDGGTFAYGDAVAFPHNPVPTEHLGGAVTGGACTKSGKGLWLAGADGGIFTLGDAVFHGAPAEKLGPAPNTPPDPTP
jgi:hypothetical protein